MKTIKPAPFHISGLAAFWLIAVAIPGFILKMNVDSLFDGYAREIEKNARDRLMSDFNAFCDDLKPEEYISRSLGEIERKMNLGKAGFEGFQHPTVWKNFQENIRRRLGAEPLLIIVSDGKAKNFLTACDKTRIQPAQMHPRRVASALMEALMMKWASQTRGKDTIEQMKGNLVKTFSSNILGLMAWPLLRWGETKGMLSFKFGGETLYLYTNFFREETGEVNEIGLGYFLAFEFKKLNQKRLIRRALLSITSPDIKRFLFRKSIRFREAWIQGKQERVSNIPRKTEFFKRGGKLYLRGVVPPKVFFNFSISRERGIPHLLIRYGTTPKIQSLERSKCLIFMLLFSGGMVTGCFLFRLWLMGETFRVSLRLKLGLALGFAVFLPLNCFWMLTRAYLDNLLHLERQRIQERLGQILEKQEGEVHWFEIRNDREIEKFKQALENVLGGPKKEIQRIFDKESNGKAFGAAFLFRDDGFIEGRKYDAERNESAEDQRKSLADVLSHLAIEILSRTDQITSEKAERFKKESKESPLGVLFSEQAQPRHINELFAFSGKAISGEVPTVGKMDTKVFLLRYRKPGGLPGSGILFVIRHSEKTAYEYFDFLEKSGSGFQEIDGDYEIHSGIFRYFRRDPPILNAEKCWPQTVWGNIDFRKLARQGMTLGGLRSQPGIDAGDRMFVVRPFTNFPVIGVAQARLRGQETLVWIDSFLSIALGGYIILILVFSSGLLFRVFDNPLRILGEGIQRIQSGEIGLKIIVQSTDELAKMACECNNMSQALLQRERMRRFMSDLAVDSVKKLNLEEERKTNLTILFSDIRNFTTLSEEHSPEMIVDLLNSYFTEMEEAIELGGGVIDKFIGDAVMALFHPTKAGEDHAFRACQAARVMRLKLAAFNQKRHAAGLFTIQTGIGIATGEVIEGRIGSNIGRQEHTVIGDTTSFASVLEGYSKKGEFTGVVLSEEVAKIVGERIPLRPLADHPEIFEIEGFPE